MYIFSIYLYYKYIIYVMAYKLYNTNLLYNLINLVLLYNFVVSNV